MLVSGTLQLLSLLYPSITASSAIRFARQIVLEVGKVLTVLCADVSSSFLLYHFDTRKNAYSCSTKATTKTELVSAASLATLEMAHDGATRYLSWSFERNGCDFREQNGTVWFSRGTVYHYSQYYSIISYSGLLSRSEYFTALNCVAHRRAGDVA